MVAKEGGRKSSVRGKLVGGCGISRQFRMCGCNSEDRIREREIWEPSSQILSCGNNKVRGVLPERMNIEKIEKSSRFPICNYNLEFLCVITNMCD